MKETQTGRVLSYEAGTEYEAQLLAEQFRTVKELHDEARRHPLQGRHELFVLHRVCAGTSRAPAEREKDGRVNEGTSQVVERKVEDSTTDTIIVTYSTPNTPPRITCIGNVATLLQI